MSFFMMDASYAGRRRHAKTLEFKTPVAGVNKRYRDFSTVGVEPLSIEFVVWLFGFIRNTTFSVLFGLSHLWFGLHGGTAKDLF